MNRSLTRKHLEELSCQGIAIRPYGLTQIEILYPPNISVEAKNQIIAWARQHKQDVRAEAVLALLENLFVKIGGGALRGQEIMDAHSQASMLSVQAHDDAQRRVNNLNHGQPMDLNSLLICKRFWQLFPPVDSSRANCEADAQR